MITTSPPYLPSLPMIHPFLKNGVIFSRSNANASLILPIYQLTLHPQNRFPFSHHPFFTHGREYHHHHQQYLLLLYLLREPHLNYLLLPSHLLRELNLHLMRHLRESPPLQQLHCHLLDLNPYFLPYGRLLPSLRLLLFLLFADLQGSLFSLIVMIQHVIISHTIYISSSMIPPMSPTTMPLLFTKKPSQDHHL